MNAWNALRLLGLPADYSDVARAREKLECESPLWVCTIVLRGQICQDMYDEHPGHTYFYSDGAQRVEAPAYCSLSEAMRISLQAFQEARRLSETDTEFDGLFTPSSIVLLDQFGEPVQEYSVRYSVGCSPRDGWLNEFPAPNEWAAMEEKAKFLDSEGRIESSWDNFETGRRLHAEAEALRRIIKIAAARERVIP